MFENETQSYYEILDIKPDASQSEIRQAYFRVKSTYGKNSAAIYSLFDDAETKQVLARVEEAFLILSHPEKRKEYDKSHGFLAPTAISMDPISSAGSAKTVSSLVKARDASTEDTGFFEESGAGNDPIIGADLNSDKTAPRTAKTFESKIGMLRKTDLVRTDASTSEAAQLIASESMFRGDFFKKIRELNGLSLDEMSAFTKISKTNVQAVEDEDFSVLPAAVYTRGFVSQIAKALRIPNEKAASAYMENYKKQSHKKN